MNSIPENNASKHSGWPSIPAVSNFVVPTCGTPDPYVNLPKSDSMQSESSVSQPQIENTTFDPTVALERALEKLENCRGLLDTNEEGTIAPIQPSEAIRAQTELSRELAAKINTDETPIETAKEAQSNFEEPIVAGQTSADQIGLGQSDEEPDHEFEAEFDHHVFGPHSDDLALDFEAFEGLTEDSNGIDNSAVADSNLAPIAIPLYAEESRSPAHPPEAVFDVRDFLDASEARPEPIPGAFQVDPYFYDFQTGEDVAQPPSEKNEPQTQASPETLEPILHTENVATSHSATTPSVEDTALIEPALDDQLFVANSGDVIQIDGSDGFDHIDLACFDIEHANVVNDVIFVDDNAGTSFEIRFRNVDYALFSDGNKIDLSDN